MQNIFQISKSLFFDDCVTEIACTFKIFGFFVFQLLISRYWSQIETADFLCVKLWIKFHAGLVGSGPVSRIDDKNDSDERNLEPRSAQNCPIMPAGLRSIGMGPDRAIFERPTYFFFMKVLHFSFSLWHGPRRR